MIDPGPVPSTAEREPGEHGPPRDTTQTYVRLAEQDAKREQATDGILKGIRGLLRRVRRRPKAAA